MSRKLYWIVSVQFGLDLRKAFRALWGLPRYMRDLDRFRSGYKGKLELLPCLYDWYEEGGAAHSEYFWQDLLVARMINQAKPEKHVDIGSRVDGFVAHIASFRDVEMFDIRPITAQIPGIMFKQWDVMSASDGMLEYCDSLSCLHALEHFGLGRYGDPVDSQGFLRGFGNMARLLKVAGMFYLAVPIGIDRVEFNANRVFDPNIVLSLARQHSLHLEKLIVVQTPERVQEFCPENAPFLELAMCRYSLGIFVFRKQ